MDENNIPLKKDGKGEIIFSGPQITQGYLNNEIKYTPTLRLINKSIFIDAGVSTDGDAAFHFMYTF